MNELNLLLIKDKIKCLRTLWSNHLNKIEKKSLPKQALRNQEEEDRKTKGKEGFQSIEAFLTVQFIRYFSTQ